VTIADADIDDLDAGEVIKLSVKRNSLLGTLFASFIRSVWTSLFCVPSSIDEGVGVGSDTNSKEYTSAEPQKAETAKGGAGEHAEDIAEAMTLLNDPEFRRLKAMYSLAGKTHIWQLMPKEEPSERAVILPDPFNAEVKNAA
jgi:hypothetical protein